jgi:hypothetical protein
VQGFDWFADQKRFEPVLAFRRDNALPPSSEKMGPWQSPPVFFHHGGSGIRTWRSSWFIGMKKRVAGGNTPK